MTAGPGTTRPHCPRTASGGASKTGICDSSPGCGCTRPRRRALAVTAEAPLRDDVHPDMIAQVLLAIAAEQAAASPVRRRVPRQRAA
ncbi:hypothetical protein ABH935_007796 [Catenulispora sp. GAS73]